MSYQLSPHSPIVYWQTATWQEYLNYRDNQDPRMTHSKLFFDLDKLLITDIDGEGLNHSKFSGLILLVLSLWSIKSSAREFTSFGRCLIEKPKTKAAAPDLVIYLGTEIPVYQGKNPKSINLDQWRVPDLVGEISDITLSIDLDEKKQLYASLNISEYWVVSVSSKQIFVFLLQADGTYQESQISQVFAGLEISLLNQALEKIYQGQATTQVTRWFSHQI